jgi:Flp pilus assembly protein TadD
VAGRCEDSLRHYETAGSLEPPDYRLLVDWALAEDCLNRTEPALARLRQAAEMERSAHVYALIGMVNGKAGQIEEAWQALDTAVEIDPNFDVTYVYRGHLKAGAGDRAGAAHDYRKALELNPGNPLAREALQRLGGR